MSKVLELIKPTLDNLELDHGWHFVESFNEYGLDSDPYISYYIRYGDDNNFKMYHVSELSFEEALGNFVRTAIIENINIWKENENERT